jgi:hypothetical protein
MDGLSALLPLTPDELGPALLVSLEPEPGDWLLSELGPRDDLLLLPLDCSLL